MNENPEKLVSEYEENMARFLELIQRANKTNCSTPFDEKIEHHRCNCNEGLLGFKN
jgi:hypothetical protein